MQAKGKSKDGYDQPIRLVQLDRTRAEIPPLVIIRTWKLEKD
jgi:hypothetical protein